MPNKTSDLAIVYDDLSIDVGALPSKDAIAVSSKIDTARENGFRVMKTEYFIDFEGKTSGEGPLMVGFAANHNAGEIEEAIEADPQSSHDDEANLHAKRPVWPLAMIPEASSARSSTGSLEQIMGKFNPKWTVPEGEGAVWWAYNMDGAILTTGTIINIFAKHYGVWLRD